MSDIMVNSLGTVTFRDNIKLSVKTLQLFQIFGMENTKEFCLNFGNLPFAGYAVKIFYIIENIMNPISGKCSIIISFIALFCIPLNDRYLKYLCIGKYIILCFCAFLKYFITSFSCFFSLRK